MIPGFISPFYFFLLGFFLFVFFVPFTLRIEANNLRDNTIIQIELIILLLGRVQFFSLQKHLNGLSLFYNSLDPALLKIFSREDKSNSLGEAMKEFMTKCFKVFLKHVSVKVCNMKIQLGTGDPYCTAIVTGIIRAASQFLVQRIRKQRQHSTVFAVAAYPSYFRKELSLQIHVELTISALRLLLFVFESGSHLFLTLINHYYRRENRCQIDLSRV